MNVAKNAMWTHSNMYPIPRLLLKLIPIQMKGAELQYQIMPIDIGGAVSWEKSRPFFLIAFYPFISSILFCFINGSPI